MAVLASNLLLGYTGLLSFAQGLFFGVGAYTASLAMQHWSVGLFSALVIAMACGGLVALLVGVLAIRRTGIYFVMLTLAFTQMGYFITYSMPGITGGDNGLLDIPRPPIAIGGVTLLDLTSFEVFYGFVALLFLLVFVGARRVIYSPFGSTLIGIRENESRASAVGYDVRQYKTLAFVLSGAITGMAGALYAMKAGMVSLESIDLNLSTEILVMTIIGGSGSLLGSLLGAGSIILIGDFFSAHWARWPMLLGLALILVVMFMPGGLWGGLESLWTRWRKPHSEKGGA
jgi:branched-chain amino acid transport system permease protein